MPSSALRTIQVVNVRWFNATAWYGMELARLLNRAGHETLTVGLADTLSFARAQKMGLSPIALPLNTQNPLRIPAVTAKMWKLIQDFRPDVVNCHRGEAFWMWGLLKKRGGYALVRTRGDQRLPRNNMPNRILHCKTADAVVATNSVMARYFTNNLGVAPNRVHTVFGGVDTSVFHFDPKRREAVRARLGFEKKHKVIGLLGRFDRVKGQKELINAAAGLVRAGMTDLRLLLIGFPTATSLEEVQGWIQNAGMESHTTITGKVDDVVGHLCALDAGVIASLWSETIARAALELMACQRPLVSTSVGVMPDLLPLEALCPPGDENALSDRLYAALTDEDFARRLVECETSRMTTLDSGHFLDETLAVYRQALDNIRGGQGNA